MAGTPQHLTLLETSGLIRLAQVLPELEYLFRHALVQEAAYSSLLKQDRRKLHLIVGEALEELYPDRLDELAGTLAHHFAAAGEREKGIAYSRRAARLAVASYAYEEALQHLRTALELVGSRKESKPGTLAVLEEMADVQRLLGQLTDSLATYGDALELWSRLPNADRITGVRLHRKIVQIVGDIKWTVGYERFDEVAQAALTSRAALQAALQPLEAGQPHLLREDPEVVRVLAALSYDAWRTQFPPEWDAAQSYAQAAVEAAEKLGAPVELSAALGTLANVYYAGGLLREHLEVALRRLDASRDPRFADVRERVDILRQAGSAFMFVGEYREAMPYLLEAESLATRINIIDQQFNALALQSQCWLRLDRWDDVLALESKWRDLERRYTRGQTGPT